MFAYTVAATFDNSDTAQSWINWLRFEHLRDVCEAGALDAEVIMFDPAATSPARGQVRCEVRYHFASREAFANYERDHAPRLRAEGMRRFPGDVGVKYERSTGEVVCDHGVPPQVN